MKLMQLRLLVLAGLFMIRLHAGAQMITGVWRGNIGSGLRSTKVELKLIQKGDSIYGSAYYYTSPQHYRRYAVVGHFNGNRQTVVWWDDVPLEEKTSSLRLLSAAAPPLLAEADFNCPGNQKMLLEGKAQTLEEGVDKGALRLSKVDKPLFHDAWDELIANYTLGGNDPEWITEVAQKQRKLPQPEEPSLRVKAEETATTPIAKNENPRTTVPPVGVQASPMPTTATAENNQPQAPIPTIVEKFTERKKVIAAEIPVEGDSVLLHFYDNAEIDGDSISLFLNQQLVFAHIRLSDKPYEVKIPTEALQAENELVMVAENLGAIPPNTSYMIAFVNGKRYTAQLESTENSSATIRLIKKE